MMSRLWLPIAIFLAGAACIGTAVATGEAEVDLLVIIPVFSGSGWLFLLGTGLIIISFLSGFLMVALPRTEDDIEVTRRSESPRPAMERKTHYGGVVLIGPMPIAFGSDKKTAVVMLLIGVAAAVVLVSIILMLG